MEIIDVADVENFVCCTDGLVYWWITNLFAKMERTYIKKSEKIPLRLFDGAEAWGACVSIGEQH